MYLWQAKRQQRKLNFLITQTELYAHFMARKMTGEGEVRKDKILRQLDEARPQKDIEVDGGVLVDIASDDYGTIVTQLLFSIYCAIEHCYFGLAKLELHIIQ